MIKLTKFLLSFILTISIFNQINSINKPVNLLTKAAINGDIQKVRDLVKVGANIDESSGGSNLAFCESDKKPLFYIPGQTALMFAAKKGDIEMVKELINLGANVNAVAFNDWPSAGNPVLYYALEGGASNLSVIKELIKAGADVNVFVGNGLDIKLANLNIRNNPLITYAISRQISPKIIKLLVKAKANVNATDEFNIWTPLILASYLGSEEIVKLLLKYRANIKQKNKFGKTALDYAREQNHNNIVNFIYFRDKNTLNALL